VPANCGLGSSSAFTVSLLNALHAYKREFASLKELAEEACDIEIREFGAPIGKQDQYMAAYGGLTCLTFEKDGNVIVEPLAIPDDKIMELEKDLLLFYTGIERRASEILEKQDAMTQGGHEKTISALHAIKDIGIESRRALESGNLDEFGELLDVHWQTKKRLSNKISDPFLDECYERAMKHGALGGKVMGAGGGGFFMFYCPNHQGKLVKAMTKAGLTLMHFRFDFEGAKIIANMRQS
jgi:D-glycero-alpha-D-manno-heptose-7-phosphate kinase